MFLETNFTIKIYYFFFS